MVCPMDVLFAFSEEEKGKKTISMTITTEFYAIKVFKDSKKRVLMVFLG